MIDLDVLRIDNDKLILLVEDNPDDEDLTIRALKKNHIVNPVVVAHDGVEAVEMLFGTGRYSGENALPRLPQLILLDLNLPLKSGLEVLKELRSAERTKYLAVVVLTSSKEEEDVITSYENATNAYVRKPVEFKKFCEVARMIGCFWLLVNENAPPSQRGSGKTMPPPPDLNEV